MVEKLKNGVNYVLDYLKANKTIAIVVIAACALVLIAIVALICKAAKKSKAKKNAAQTQAQTAQKTTAAQATAPVATEKKQADEAAEKEAARQATLKRLEEERLAAEREEEEKLAAEKAVAEKAEAERLAAEKAEADRIAAEKVAAEKAAKAEKAKQAREAKKAAAPAETKKAPAAKATASTAATKTAKAPAKTAAKPAASEESNKYAGKWSVFHLVTKNTSGEIEEETYYFELRASNGEKLLSSEEYTSQSGALKGIETHKTNIEKGNFKITLSKKGDYIFKLLNGKNMLLCTGENYKTQARCESAIESTKRFAKTAVVDDKLHEKVVKLPVEEETEAAPEYADYINGKWIVVSRKGANDEDLFYFELYANNGEKLLSSEDYTSYIGAVNGIQTHKTNIEKGNFRISLTKKGDYIYKLLNGNGQLLCLGEHYKTKSRCESAVESVKRFAKNSPVLTDPEHTK